MRRSHQRELGRRVSAPAAPEIRESAAGTGTRAQVTTVTGAVATSWNDASGACKEVAEQRYPFFGASAQDAQMLDMLQVFGGGGTLNIRRAASQAVDRHQRANVALARRQCHHGRIQSRLAGGIRKGRANSDLLTTGLAVKVRVEQFGSDTDAVEISSGNGTQRLDEDIRDRASLSWSPQGKSGSICSDVPGDPGAASANAGGACGDGGTGRLADRGEQAAPTRLSFAPPASSSTQWHQRGGPWALFRLMDKADEQNAGPRRSWQRSIRVRMGHLVIRTSFAEHPFGAAACGRFAARFAVSAGIVLGKLPFHGDFVAQGGQRLRA